MIEPTMDHVNALCHAEFFYNAAISKLDGGRMRKAAEDDLLRLAELKLHIIQGLTNPQKQLNLEDSHYGDTDKS